MNEIERAAAEEFDGWAREGRDEAMSRGHGRFTEIALAAWDLRPEHRVLDVGCGNGWAVRRMIALGAGSGVGVDIAAEMIARAVPPGEYHVASGDALPSPDKHFSHVLSIESIYYYPDPADALREWARVARPGAQLSLLIDLFAENPSATIWRELLPIPVHIIGAADWTEMAQACGWREIGHSRIPDPRGVRAREDFEPDEWTPTYEDYLAFKAAGTLWLRAVR